MTRRPPAFVLGESMNALGVVAALGRRGVPVHVFTHVPDDLASHSRFARTVHVVPAADPEGTLRLLEAEARRLGVRPALVYTTDRNLRLVSRARERLAPTFHLQLPPRESVEIVLDKERFARFTEAHGFPAPRTFAPATLADAERVAAEARYPVVMKPALSFDWAGRGFKMRKASHASALVAAWKHLHTAESAVIVQEYIDAPDDQHYAYYSYRSPGRGELAHVLVRKLRVYPIHAGAGSFLEVTRDPQMEALGRALLERLDYAGVGSVCFKKESRSGEPFIYELNGRFPQCHKAFELCGQDVPWLMYRDMVGDPLSAPPYRESTQRWVSLSLDLAAFEQYRARGDLGLVEWLRSYRGVRSCAEFSLDDPLPLLQLAGRSAWHLCTGTRARRQRRPVHA